MSEAAEKTEVVEPAGEEVVTPEYSAEEQEALDSGWNPEGQDKDGKTLNAQEYMARKPLFNKIHNLRTEQTDMKTQLDTLRGDMMKMTQSFMKEKAGLLEQLKEQRNDALDNMENDKVKELDKQIERVGAAEQPQATQSSQAEWKSAYISFLKKNAWYDQQPGLKSAADLIGQEFASNNPTARPNDVYNHVSNEIKKEFPDRFDSKPDGQQKSSKVSTSNRRSSQSVKKQAVKLSDLDPDTQKIVEVMAKGVGKTTDEYLKNYEL